MYLSNHLVGGRIVNIDPFVGGRIEKLVSNDILSFGRNIATSKTQASHRSWELDSLQQIIQ